MIQLDEYTIYADTDSLKLKKGYNKEVIENYNKQVMERIENVSKLLDINISKFSPKDSDGIEHPLGVFDDDGHYEKFITQGAKKYAYYKYVKNSKLKKTSNIIEKGIEKSLVLEITVAGVPKIGANAMKQIEDFRDDLVFDYNTTGKKLLMYTEHQDEMELEDYQGNVVIENNISGCCILPTTYVLGKALDYMHLLSDDSSARSIYLEG